ncbi:MAG: hydantoinase [SAR86 cluster bacterium]|uniref:Hydantoinase n=1 Tax=SAR86 cluster bacterium TaxID=2030880 RepID=A0A2A4MSQ6_9GAMM|nr:MAG: hydantoinase [SAR86 cluster bacterium]
MSNEQILGIDAGGTFTDFVLVSKCAGVSSLRQHKVASTPQAPEQAILTGISEMGLTEVAANGQLRIIHGSTVATNAALEGRGVKTAYVSNYGLGDVLTLARQTRPSLYALEFAPRQVPVTEQYCLETGGRITAKGEVLEALCEAELKLLVSSLRQLQPEAVAINLLFSYVDDSFEKRIEAAIVDAKLAMTVSRSSQVLPEYKEYERGIATWLNASLGPLVSNYLSSLQRQLPHCDLQIMQSSGSTINVKAAAKAAVNLLLSGPAAGLAGISYLGELIGERRIISFDMGGTSTDVALIDGEIQITNEGSIADYPVSVPMVDMHTIGAGGGSIASVDEGGMLQVGPRSAGAEPGPACYGKGGELPTVTDANLVLGRLPEINAENASFSMRLDLAQAAILPLSRSMQLSVEATAQGIIDIANEHMAKAIRMISVQRGYHAGEFILASFGGAGGLHVCAIAEAMQMRRAIVPVYAGVLSALGMVVAPRGRQFSKTVNINLADCDNQFIQTQFTQFLESSTVQMRVDLTKNERLITNLSVDIRYTGQSYTLTIPWENSQQVCRAFHRQHSQRYGYAMENGQMELVNLRLNISEDAEKIDLEELLCQQSEKLQPHHQVFNNSISGDTKEISIIAKHTLAVGQRVIGPAVISEFSATTFIAKSWSACIDKMGNIVLLMDVQ